MSDMNALGLLVGHLIGDYVWQNDWMAGNKTKPHPGPAPAFGPLRDHEQERSFEAEIALWTARKQDYRRGHLACLTHCTAYTLAVWLCSWWWLPWWGVLLCFLLHFPVDRWRLARKWMTAMGQEDFATGMFAPWSIIAVDNTFHLLVLFLIGLAAECNP